MLKRTLGRSGIEVGALGIGGWAIGGPWHEAGTRHPLGWGEVDDRESIDAIHCALDSGISLIDTSDNYGAGHSERVIGEAIRGRRDRVVLATKFGYVTNERTKEQLGEKASRDYIRRACEASLNRLGTDYIDLYQFHINQFPEGLVPHVLETLEELVGEGKIRYFGWSTDSTGRAALFAKSPNCVAIQHELNVFCNHPAMLDLCERQGLASLNRGPLAMGLLTGKYSDAIRVNDPKDIRRRSNLEWLGYFKDGLPSSMLIDRLQAIREILTSGGRTLSQGALGWLWAKSEQTIPIPGFRTARQVSENAKAMAFGPLTPGSMREIERLLG